MSRARFVFLSQRLGPPNHPPNKLASHQANQPTTIQPLSRRCLSNQSWGQAHKPRGRWPMDWMISVEMKILVSFALGWKDCLQVQNFLESHLSQLSQEVASLHNGVQVWKKKQSVCTWNCPVWEIQKLSNFTWTTFVWVPLVHSQTFSDWKHWNSLQPFVNLG